MSELQRQPRTTEGMPAQPPSTLYALPATSRQDLDPALRARLRYLASRRFEIRATDVDDIVHAALKAYRRTAPWRGTEPVRHDILVGLFRQECFRFLEHLGRLGREASTCYRNPEPRGIGTDALCGCEDVAGGGPGSRRPAETLGQAVRVLIEIRPAASDTDSGHFSRDGRCRADDRDSGAPPFVRRRRQRGLCLRTILTSDGRGR